MEKLSLTKEEHLFLICSTIHRKEVVERLISAFENTSENDLLKNYEKELTMLNNLLTKIYY